MITTELLNRAAEVSAVVCERIRERVFAEDSFFRGEEGITVSFSFSTLPTWEPFSVHEYQFYISCGWRWESNYQEVNLWSKERLRGIGIELTHEEEKFLALQYLWRRKGGCQNNISALGAALADPGPSTDIERCKVAFDHEKRHLANIEVALQSLGF